MKIIRTLVLRYMKRNRKRTLATIAGITVSVMLLTVITIFTFTLLHSMIRQEVSENGTWHATFHNLSEEQFEQLEKSAKVKKCTVSKACKVYDHSRNSNVCADVEMRHVSYFMFGATQKMAAEIGMEKLPYGEGELLPNRKISNYDITYHMNLLEYYGTSTADGMGKGIMMFGLLGMSVVLAAVFVYNFYAVSLYERIKYIGVLGSAGATKFQRSLVILFEGMVEGAVSFPIGFLLGFAVSKGLLWFLNTAGGTKEGFPMVCNVPCVAVILICTVVMLFLAVTGPIRQAAEITLAEQLTAAAPKELEGQSFTNLRKPHPVLGLEGAMGIKNVYRNKPRYLVTCVLILISMGLLLDGYTYFDESDFVADRRTRPKLGTWIEIQDQNPAVLEELFEKLEGMDEISVLAGVMSMDLNYQDSGKQRKLRLSGLDDKTFEEYMKQAEKLTDTAEQARYPVLLDNYVLRPEEKKMGEIPGYDWGEPIEIQNQTSEKGTAQELTVTDITSAAPPYPYFSRNLEDIDGFREYEADYIHVYMKIGDLARLAEALQYQGDILKFIYVDRVKQEDTAESGFLDRVIYKKELKEKAKEDHEFQEKIIEAARELGMSQFPLNQRTTANVFHKYVPREKGYSIGSADIWKSEQMLASGQALKKLFTYGMVVLIIALSLTSIFQNISMSMRVRKREFAILHSIGMTKMEIFRMVMTENALFGIVGAGFGIPFSVFLMYQIRKEQFLRYGTIPVKILLVQLGVLVLVSLVPAVYIRRQLKDLKIIENIKTEG